jgi:beta-glucanase (GH16 family)
MAVPSRLAGVVRLRCVAPVLALLACVAGCGGGGDGVVAAVEVPPAPPAIAAPPAVVAPPAASAPTPAGVPAGYVLVWSDEFDQPGLPDPAKWAYDTERNRAGWYNNELQYYAANRSENAQVRDGRLHITARLESLTSAPDWGGQRYTSARLITRGLASWTRGFFEVRAKLPCGQGTWPAIWTLGTGGRWPADGEIDIMEQVGSNPTRVFGTVHTAAFHAGAGVSGATQVPDACTAFHDYQMTWTDDAIEFAVDGKPHHRYANPRTGRAAWPFDAPQYLLLNIAIGGVLGGTVNDRIFPVTMEVAHVRVYQVPR